MAVASNWDPTAVRTEGGEENVMMACKSVNAVLTIKGHDEVLGGAGRPATAKETEGGFVGKKFALKAANNLVGTRQGGRRDLGTDKNGVCGALKTWN